MEGPEIVFALPRPSPRVLVASSLRPESDGAIEVGLSLARGLGASVTVVHGLDRDAVSSGPFGTGWIEEDRADDERRSGALRLREQLARCEVANGCRPASIIEPESVSRLVTHESRDRRTEVVVVGPPDGGGAIVDRIVRSSPVPVVIARPRLDLPLTEIVVGVDLSPTSGDALRWAVTLARRIGAEDIVPKAVLAIDSDETPRISEAATERLLQFVADTVEGHAAPLVRRGSPTDVLVTTVREAEAPLLVIGSHGSGGYERFLTGHHVADLIRAAPCSVAVVPPTVDLRPPT